MYKITIEWLFEFYTKTCEQIYGKPLDKNMLIKNFIEIVPPFIPTWIVDAWLREIGSEE